MHLWVTITLHKLQLFFKYFLLSSCFFSHTCVLLVKYTAGTAGLCSHGWTDRWWVVPASTSSIMSHAEIHTHTHTHTGSCFHHPPWSDAMSFSTTISQALYTLILSTHALPKQAPCSEKDITKAMKSILLQRLKAHFLNRLSLTTDAHSHGTHT